MSLTDPIDDRYRRGVRVNAWLHVEPASGQSKRDLLRALGIRGRKSYPVQARIKGEALVLRMEAHYSPFENQSRGALRSYLERKEAQDPEHTRSVFTNGLGHPENVLQNAHLEQWLDRWSIWMNPSAHDVNPHTAIDVLVKELERRFGVHEDDIYVVQHHDRDDAGKATGKWHLHAVIRAEPGMNLDRKTVQEIGRVMVRELVLERAVERALDPDRRRADEGAASGWDQPPTDAQMAVLHKAGKPGRDLTRGDASLAIEAIVGESSWVPSDLSRGR